MSAPDGQQQGSADPVLVVSEPPVGGGAESSVASTPLAVAAAAATTSDSQSPSRTSASTISQSLSNLDLEDDEADMKILDSEVGDPSQASSSQTRSSKFPWIPPTEILGNLYLGSALSAMPFDAVKGLKSLGISVIINCTERCPNKYPDDFQYLQLNFRDDLAQNIFDTIFDTADFIHDQILGGQSVMVHCMAGKSRSSAVIIGYLMIKYDMSLREAYKHVALKRPKIAPNASFFIQLMRLEKALGREPSLNLKQYAILVAISQKKAGAKSKPILEQKQD